MADCCHAIILVIAAGIGLFYLVKKIDDNEQKKDDEKLKKMVKEVVKEVMEEIRNGKQKQITNPNTEIVCKHCQSANVRKYGFYKEKQIYYCNECHHKFMLMTNYSA